MMLYSMLVPPTVKHARAIARRATAQCQARHTRLWRLGGDVTFPKLIPLTYAAAIIDPLAFPKAGRYCSTQTPDCARGITL